MAPFILGVLFITAEKEPSVLVLEVIMFKGKRSWHESPWHNCSRCDTKTHISDLKWQRGLLLCEMCYDTGNDGYPLVGQREAAITSYLDHQTQELMPDPKLTDVGEIAASMEEDLIV